MNYNITKQQAYNFLVALSELQDNTVDDYFRFTHLLSELISGENDNKWILEINSFTYFYLNLYFRDSDDILYGYEIRLDYNGYSSVFSINYTNFVDSSKSFFKTINFFSSKLQNNSKTFFMTKPSSFVVPQSVSELVEVSVLTVTGNLTLFNFKQITDNNKLYLLRTAFLDVDNNIVINEPNKTSSFGLAFNSFIARLKLTDKIARYTNTNTVVFLNDIDCSLDGLISSSSQYNLFTSCSVPQFFRTVHFGLQSDSVYFCSDDFEFLDTDYEEWGGEPLSQCPNEFEVDCEDCAQINDVFRSIFNAFQMINNTVESDNKDMPDYTQILTNINANLANIHSDLHATVLDEQDNPVDMNVPQVLVEVNNSLQADTDKPIIVSNEDLRPWSPV